MQKKMSGISKELSEIAVKIFYLSQYRKMEGNSV